jgi:clan AA aspartic protease
MKATGEAPSRYREMGITMAKVKLTNFIDRSNAENGIIGADRVRSAEIDAIADTGAISLAIPEEIAEGLGLTVTRYDRVRVADGRPLVLPVVGVFVEMLGRSMLTEALVLPQGARSLLGAVQLEMMDLVVVPGTQEVITNPEHPDGPELLLLRAS